MVKRAGKLHVSSRTIEWTSTAALGAHADYCEKPPAFTLGAAQGGSQLTKRTTEDKIGNTFKNTLAVPPIGGIQYDIRAAKVVAGSPNNAKLGEDYIAWRKLHYTVNHMNDTVKAMFDSISGEVKTLLEAVFIELEEAESLRCKGGDELFTLRPANTIKDEITFKAKHAGELAHAPRHLRVLVVNDVCTTENKFISDGSWSTASVAQDMVFDAGTNVLRIKSTLPSAWYVKAHQLTSMSFRPEAGAGDEICGLKNAALEGKYTVAIAGDPAVVYFDVPLDTDALRPALTRIRAGAKLSINAGFSCRKSLGGYYTDDTNVILVTALKKAGEPADTSRLRTLGGFAHELAHALGLVRASEKRRGGGGAFAPEANALSYTGQGGVGTHCKTNTKDALVAGVRVAEDAGDLCIMFHNLMPGRTPDFCPSCKAHLVRNEVKLAV